MNKILVTITCLVGIIGIIWFGVRPDCSNNNKQIQYITMKKTDLSSLQVKIPLLDLNDKTVQESFHELSLLWKKQLPDKPLPKIVFIGLPRKDQQVDLIVNNRSVLDCIMYICLCSGMKYCILEGNVILQSKEVDNIEGMGVKSIVFPEDLMQYLEINKKFSKKTVIDFFDGYGIKVHDIYKDTVYPELDNLFTIEANYTDIEKINFLLEIDEFTKKLWKDAKYN